MVPLGNLRNNLLDNMRLYCKKKKKDPCEECTAGRVGGPKYKNVPCPKVPPPPNPPGTWQCPDDLLHRYKTKKDPPHSRKKKESAGLKVPFFVEEVPRTHQLGI